MLHERFGVAVLGFQITDRLGIGSVAQPEVGIDARVPVKGRHMGNCLSYRRGRPVGCGGHYVSPYDNIPRLNILVPNLGSTSLKFQILAMPEEAVLAKGRFERVADYGSAIQEIRTGSTPIDAVAFKAVHGGPRYCGTFLIDAGVLAALEQFLPAAPAHNAIYLTAIRAFRQAMPGVPLVAAFETEFHATIPAHASLYGVPAAWRDAGVRRYGFHGASHQYVAERVAAMLGRPKEALRTISCHLGGSSSMCAIERGRSVDTTMGFSPQSGLRTPRATAISMLSRCST